MATEKRLIERIAERLKDAYPQADRNNLCPAIYYDDFAEIVDDVLSEVGEALDAVEVVHSKWDTVFYERNGTLASYSHLCPECKYFYRDVRFKGHNYCPNCGAKMDGGADNV